MPRRRLTKRDFERLAAWRHSLRQFLRFSQHAARGIGVPPQQHQALLAIKGFPGRDYVTIGELADRLHVRHHSAVGLVDRLADRGLIQRTPSKEDRRCIEVRLTTKGEALIEQLSAVHVDELRQLAPVLEELLRTVKSP